VLHYFFVKLKVKLLIYYVRTSEKSVYKNESSLEQRPTLRTQEMVSASVLFSENPQIAQFEQYVDFNLTFSVYCNVIHVPLHTIILKNVMQYYEFKMRLLAMHCQ